MREFFASNPNQDAQNQTRSAVHVPTPKKNSFFTPEEGRNPKLDLYINTLRCRIKTECLQRHHKLNYNLTAAQRRAIESLRLNTSIIIKPADKGGATVIQNREDYVREAHRQLNNNGHYRLLDSDPTTVFRKELLTVIRNFPPALKRYVNSLIPVTAPPGYFYLLPKIHKIGNPGRPIISGTNTLCEQISGYVEGILKPIVKTTPSFVLDSNDFLSRINTVENLLTGCLLVTMDVNSLYTNIPHADGIRALRSHLNDDNCPSVDAVIALTEFILTHNYFSFQDEIDLRLTGMAMGTRMAPQYANLFMSRLEQDFLDTCTLKPLCYLRYIDDIFFIWPHGEESLINFHRNFTDFHPTIDLKMEYSTESVNFLDMLVSISGDTLHTSLYRKPTDNLSYLHRDSFHPAHVKNSIPFSQALRYHRICSDTNDRDVHLSVLRKRLVEIGYDINAANKQFRKAVQFDRNDLISSTSRKSNDDRIPLVLTYQPHFHRINTILRDLQPILRDDPYLSAVFPQIPIISYRQPTSIRRRLIRSQLQSTDGQEVGSISRCHAHSCLTCDVVYNEAIIRGNDQVSHTIRGHFSCSSSNIVYLIRCSKCPNAWYVGETSQMLKRRMNGHRASLNNPVHEMPVSIHFNLPHHSYNDMKVSILQGGLSDISQRKIAEQKFIHLFQTHKYGLNRQLGFMSHYTEN